MEKDPFAHFHKLDQVIQDTCLALVPLIKSIDPEIENSWKWGMPFFGYKNKMLAYLWYDKKKKSIYIGFLDGNKLNHPLLVKDNRARIRIIYIQHDEDFPVDIIKELFLNAIAIKNTSKSKMKKSAKNELE